MTDIFQIEMVVRTYFKNELPTPMGGRKIF